jgi:hypothetical protein
VFGYDPAAIVGGALGGIIAIYAVSMLIRYALLGRSGTKLQNLGIVILTGAVAIGFSAFGDGTDGFANRITNPPDMFQVVTYSLATLIVATLVWWRTKEALPTDGPAETGSMVGRAVAVVFVVPMILIAIGNLVSSTYFVAVNGQTLSSGGGSTSEELREIMLTGDMAPFWTLVDQRAPEEIDYIIDQFRANEASFKSEDEVRTFLEKALVSLRVSLATYGPALSDTQRKEIIQSHLDLLQSVENQPVLCSDLSMTGGTNLSQEQLLTVIDEYTRAIVVMTGHLLDAKAKASDGSVMPRPPTEEDYGALVASLFAAGMTEDQMLLIYEQKASHPEFCSAVIRFMDGVVALEGTVGEAVRFEVTQLTLTASP